MKSFSFSPPCHLCFNFVLLHFGRITRQGRSKFEVNAILFSKKSFQSHTTGSLDVLWLVKCACMYFQSGVCFETFNSQKQNHRCRISSKVSLDSEIKTWKNEKFYIFLNLQEAKLKFLNRNAGFFQHFCSTFRNFLKDLLPSQIRKWNFILSHRIFYDFKIFFSVSEPHPPSQYGPKLIFSLFFPYSSWNMCINE